jgi:hypothetical protein
MRPRLLLYAALMLMFGAVQAGEVTRSFGVLNQRSATLTAKY